MRTRVLVDSSLVTAGLVAIIGSAGADSMSVSRGQPVAETAHSVVVHITDGVATFTVQRQFYNPGDQAEQVGLEIRLPEGAAATGLRIKARQRWYTGELMEAGAASDRYRSLTGYGAFEVKDPALLSWMDPISLPKGVSAISTAPSFRQKTLPAVSLIPLADDRRATRMRSNAGWPGRRRTSA